MRRLGKAAAVMAILAVTACAPRPAPPPPTPLPTRPPPPPRPAPVPPPAPLAWQDAPISPGNWSHQGDSERSTASFAAGDGPSFLVRCASGRIGLVRIGASGGAITIRTSTGERAIPANAGSQGLVATLDANDPLLDAIAFSRGRFAVEASGAPLLILPAWPETARVIEDCRS